MSVSSFASLAFTNCVSEDKMLRTHVWITLKNPSGFPLDRSHSEEQIVGILISRVSQNTELDKSMACKKLIFLDSFPQIELLS